MANEALKKIRDELSGGRNMTTEYLRDLVDQAIAHAVEEATSQPQHQCAVQQARLMRAKADLLELQVAERRGELVKVSDVEKQIEVHFDGLRFHASHVIDAALAVRLAEAMQAGRIDLPTTAAPGIAEALAHDQRIKRYRAMEDERRVLGLAEDAQDQAKRIEQAELRGFYKGRGKALEIVFAERNNWTTDLVRDALAKVSEAIVYMQKEG